MPKPLSHLYEMPRPAGTWSGPKRAALQKAKEHGQPFTVKDFAAWMKAAGGATDNPMSVGPYLKKISADGQQGRPKRPDALHPLQVHLAGRRGIGGSGTYIYALDPSMSVGTDPAKPKGTQPTGDDDDDELAAMGFRKVGGDDEVDPPEGEFSQADDEDWGDDDAAPEPEPDDEPEDEPPHSGDDWIPQPDPMGSYAESSMAKCADKGFGPDNELWTRIAQTKNNVDAHALIRKELPITLQRPALAIAKQIFQNIEKDWDGNESRSLYRAYGLLKV